MDETFLMANPQWGKVVDARFSAKKELTMSVNEIAVFVSSSDAYSDIWPAFFALLKREWPEYRGTIYLNTETLEYAHDGLNIVCTKQGNQHRFGAFFLHGVECVE